MLSRWRTVPFCLYDPRFRICRCSSSALWLATVHTRSPFLEHRSCGVVSERSELVGDDDMDREQLYAPAPAYELESSASESDDSDDDGEHRHFAAYGLRAKRAGAGASSLGRAARYGELNVRIGSVGSATGQGDAGELLVLVGDAGERFSRFVRPGAVLEGQGQQVELVRPGVDNEESMQVRWRARWHSV